MSDWIELPEVDTAGLSGPALDWAVAEAGGYYTYFDDECGWLCDTDESPGNGLTIGEGQPFGWSPSCDWEVCGPLIEKHKIDLHYQGRLWIAQCETVSQESPIGAFGETPLQAACRALVALKFGDKVRVPEDLTEPSVAG